MTDHILRIPLSHEEYQRLSDAAQAAGKTVYEYLTDLALGKGRERPRPTAPMGALGDVEIKADLAGERDEAGSPERPERRPR